MRHAATINTGRKFSWATVFGGAFAVFTVHAANRHDDATMTSGTIGLDDPALLELAQIVADRHGMQLTAKPAPKRTRRRRAA